MMRKAALYLVAASAVLTAAGASAQDGVIKASHGAILDGRFAVAERQLDAERRIYPDKPEVLLNLAAVYAQTGRVAQANALYRDVLSRDDVAMDLTRDRVASAHAIARTGLARLAPTMTASR